MRSLAGVLTAAMILYVGGPAMALFVVSVLVTAAALQRSPQFRGEVGVLVSLVVHLSWLMIYLWKVLPLILKVPGLRSLVAQPLNQVGFHSITFPASSVEMWWLGSLLALCAPGLISAALLVRGRSQFKPFGQPIMGSMAWLVAVVPFAYVSVLKCVDQWHALAFTMSGDGRNHFVVIEEIRVQSISSLSPLTLNAPRLSNAIAALFSSGNGTSGVLQRADLHSMMSIYVLSAAILGLAVVTGFVAALRTGASRSVVLPLAGCAVLLATNSLVLSTVLRDGFMTLYFGTAVLGASLVVMALLHNPRTKVLVGVGAVVAMVGAYSFLAPVIGVVLLVEVYRWMWTMASPRRRAVAIACCSIALVLVAVVVGRGSFDEFEVTAALYGSVAKVDTGILWVLLAIAVALWLTGGKEARSAGFTGTVAVLTALVVVFFIERIPANQAAGYSYYASKTIVGTAGAVLCLSFIPVAARVGGDRPNRTGRLAATVGITAVALVPYALAEEASTLARPWSDIRNGWANPDSPSIPAVVERWGDDPYLFFRYGNNMPLVQRPSAVDDRALNFWSPVTWATTGPWVPLYQWVYNEATTSDASELCSPIENGVQTIYTSDPELKAQVMEGCGAPDVDIIVLPEVGPN